MSEEIQLIKRNGSEEALDINKIHKVLMWACEGVENVSVSEIEAQAMLKFVNGMKTSDLHNSLVDATHELISEATPNYDIVAGRLVMFDIRKKAYQQYDVPHLYDIVQKNVKEGWYHPDLLNMYTIDEWDTIDSFITHDNDFKFKISGAREWVNKYLVQNRVTKEYKESPQVAYALIAAILMKKYQPKFGLMLVKEYYEDLSSGDISIPSPVASGIRTPKPQGASCTVIEVGDDLESIGASTSAVLRYASNKAGLGIGVQNLRAGRQPIRNGEATTTGPIPFAQLLQAAVASCSQGGMRKGSATFYHNIWHLDVESLIVLKNNKGTEETRIRHADHGFNLNGFLLKKILRGERVFLFSPEEVPDLLEAFYADQPKFEKLYEKYSRSTTVTKRAIDGVVLRDLIVNERSGTSRVYLHFVDNSNEQGSFLAEFAPIRLSNLCLEITLPTLPLYHIDDETGLISLCTLSALNWGKVKKPSDFKRMARNAVFALDSLLDYQPYLLPAARNSTDWYRPLGIGVSNLAYFLAKRGLKFNDAALEVVDEYMEAQAYYLTLASVQLAKMYGPCGKVENTKYSKGIVPFDVRKKAIDELVPPVEREDWATLRHDLKAFGIRNATLMANMPAETSARIHGMTNGGEPVRSLITTKSGTKTVVPEFNRLKNKYDLEWDMDLDGYIKVQAVMQKRMDQAISLNTRYVPENYPDQMVPATTILRHIGMIYKYGLKTAYYHNNKKVIKSDEERAVEQEEQIRIEVDEEADCPGCTI